MLYFVPYENFKMESLNSLQFSPQERRLYGQVGFEGCLLLRTSPQGISKICSILMGWETLQAPSPLL